jgi:hypothetical protein
MITPSSIAIARSHSGQTLVEVMVALFVLVTGFLGILSLLSQSITLSKTVSNQTIASYLSEEGVEIAKNLIDHDVYNISGTGWGSCFNLTSGDYELDYTTTGCPLRAYSADDLLTYNPTTHMYIYAYNDLIGGGTATPFTRDIRVTFNGPDEITVQSIVSWNAGGFSQQSVNVEDHFYNWIP